MVNFRRFFGASSSRPREARSSAMVLTVTEDTPADMLAGSMELLVQIPRDHHVQTQRVTVQRSTPMMDLLVQIATAHKLAASSYTLQAIGERGLVLPHQPNTPIGALDALQVKLLPKQGTFLARKNRQSNQPFETTFRLQVHLPRNQLYVSRVSPKTNLGEILNEVCREKNLDRNKYELRHPANQSETLDLSLTLQDYALQEVTLCQLQRSSSNSTSHISRSQSSDRDDDIMSHLHHQQQHQKQQNQQQHQHRETKQKSNQKSGGGVFGFVFGRHKSKENSVSSESSLENRSASPARSDETGRSTSPPPPASKGRPAHQQQYQQQQSVVGSMQPPSQPVQQQQQQQPPRPTRKRRPAPKPPAQQQQQSSERTQTTTSAARSKSESHAIITSTMSSSSTTSDKDKIVISHSRNSSDSSGYHEASVLSDNPDNSGGSGARMPETLPRIKGRTQSILETPRKLAHTSQASKSLSNLAMTSGPGLLAGSGATLTRGISNTSISSTGQRKKRAAPAPPMARPLPSAISVQGLERIVDSDESLTSDMDLSKPSSDIEATLGSGSSQASSDIAACHPRPTNTSQPPQQLAPAVDTARVVHAKGSSNATDTDILLQKVSDTLSHALAPPSPPPTPVDERADAVIGLQQQHQSVRDPSSVAGVPQRLDTKDDAANTNIDRASKKQEDRQDDSTSVVAATSAASNDGTLGSQQDTSDYVSNSGGEEQLSIADWEYQIPAPPSAFRDDCNSIVSLSSKSVSSPITPIEPLTKESTISIEAEIHQRASTTSKAPSITKATIELQKQAKPTPKTSSPKSSPSEPVEDNSSRDSVDHCTSLPQTQPTSQTTTARHKSIEGESELKKEVISELESKISHANTRLEQTVASKEDPCTPAKIAPVENNLSNFTITTYGRQKSLQDIFEPMEQQQQQRSGGYSGRLAVGSSATLGRGKSLASTTDLTAKNGFGGLKSAQSIERVNAISSLVDHGRSKFGDRGDVVRDKAIVHRSKSYITLASNEKFQNRVNHIERNKDEKKLETRPSFDITDSSRRMTSVVNLNSNSSYEIPKHKEKFSQWRDNILRKQEDPSPEKQLQSLQVLKSILPQLKSAQATAESNYKSSVDNLITSKRQDPEPDKIRETSPASITSETVKLRSVSRSNQHEPSKRYTYCGPPSVSLGSWSERPSVNVQIKNDTDYKLGGEPGSLSGSRTVVSLNSNERPQGKSTSQSALSDDKKRETSREIEKDDEPRVDTSSVNFKELTKAFGQAEVRMRPKPALGARPNVLHRHSEYLDRPKQNGFPDSHVLSTSTSSGVNQRPILNGSTNSIKRYTSVVGINNNANNGSSSGNSSVGNNANILDASSKFKNHINGINDRNCNDNISNAAQNTNFRFVNGQSKVPTVPKSLSNGQKDRESVVPRPPTMPIITGVTLKSVSARTKSNPLPIQQDPRDQLLESIRNFGGQSRLRKANERH